MSCSSDELAYANCHSTAASHKKFKGIRRRKWGKWVSEIRVPGTPQRLWLGSYAPPEAAAVAHDVAFYCLRGNSSPQNLNFPLVLPASARVGMSPRSVQKASSDAGLAVDARLLDSKNKSSFIEEGKKVNHLEEEHNTWQRNGGNWGGETSGWPLTTDEEQLSVSVEDYL
ncbi:ethylene-responsive transcription factor ERF020 [Sesamum indicum]|uniref:Ethylene-responsive transcription factor ERF020 n=1 Tax=Sesamum indicum TaxID=4182 RepID=A0A6I9U513_SESIN|nr:ethylene-responsive transcription factor ERF020 [Sesamum indicum]